MLRTASLAATAVLLSAPLAGQSPDRDPSRLRAGLLLYAAPGVEEPRFGQTVVLLLEHGAKGSMGLVVNRPTEVPLGRALKRDDPRGSSLPLYWGGPVQPEAIHALVRSAPPNSEARTVVKGVLVTGALSDVNDALAGPEPSARVRVYSGYAGWAAGQLAGEVRAGVWVLDRADAASVFAAEPEKLWLRVYRLLDRLEARVAAPPAQPDLLLPRRALVRGRGRGVRRARHGVRLLRGALEATTRGPLPAVQLRGEPVSGRWALGRSIALAISLAPALAAGSAAGAQAAVEPPPDLAAIGVIVGATPERSVAILQSGGRTRSAQVGASVFGGVVTAVARHKVMLDFDGRVVELRLTTGEPLAGEPWRDPLVEASTPPPGEAMGVGAGPKRRTLDRAEVERRINEEMPRLIQAALRPVSEDGRVIGMRISQIPDGTILQDVGIQSGDVITDINGVRIDGLPALMGLWSSLQGASELSATVLRDGVIHGLGVTLR